MDIFVLFINLLAAAFALAFAAEIITLLIGCVVWLWRWQKARRMK